MTRPNYPVCAALLFLALVWCVAVVLYRSLA